MTMKLLVLVFAGAFAFFGIAFVNVYRVMRRRVEEVAEKADVPSPTRRFIHPRALFSARFTSASALFALAVFALLCGDVTLPEVYLPVGAFLGFIGWKVPLWWFLLKAKKRKALFDSQILNLTMSLANGLRSGLALPQALETTAHRIAAPMSEELTIVMREMRLGLDLSEAMERLHSRMPGEDLRLLVTSVKLTAQSGGNLSDVLGRMVEMIRSRTEFNEKVKTMTAQGRFEAIAMSLAPLFVYLILRLIDSELMKPLTSTFAGWCTIAAVTTMITVGFLFINKIVTIEV